MKSIVLSFCLLVFSAFLRAQTEQLTIKSSPRGFYVEHKVAAKENFYSIGRLFNVHPKHLASFNSLNMARGLSLGQTIKIPLSDTNFSRKSDVGTPVYYVTGTGETIYNVSTNNDVLMERLRKWNQISNDKLPPGSRLIIGFLMTPSTQAMAVNNQQNVESSNKNTKAPLKDPAKDEIVSKPEAKKEEVKKEEEPKRNNDVMQVKEVNTPILEQGYFKTSFEQQLKQQPITNEQTVTSGIFKTSSGWTDSKFYLLMDGAEPGTIVRITNPSNNRIVYAKLLGEMPDLKQNQGLNIRISNAAAAALDIAETEKFIVKLNF